MRTPKRLDRLALMQIAVAGVETGLQVPGFALAFAACFCRPEELNFLVQAWKAASTKAQSLYPGGSLTNL
jgi:hypothetical protein